MRYILLLCLSLNTFAGSLECDQISRQISIVESQINSAGENTDLRLELVLRLHDLLLEQQRECEYD